MKWPEIMLNSDMARSCCASEAVFATQQRIAQVTTKNPQLQEEKISVRRKARSQVTLEKSSKNYISLFGGKPARGLPTPPPTSPRAVTAHFPRVGRQVRTASARFTCENHSREGGGEGGMICETVPFDNESSDQLQTQDEDSQ